jgi:hypothetical protein
VIEIRSYRRVFDLERRIYRVDRLRLNPGGVPVQGIFYYLAALVAVVVVSRLPLFGSLTAHAPWYLRYLAVPGASAALLGVVRLEGRSFHLAALSLLRYRCAASLAVPGVRGAAKADRWCPSELLFLPDGSDARMRRLRYSGPGALLVTREHVRSEPAAALGGRRWPLGSRRAALVIRERPGARVLRRREVISLASGARVVVRSHSAGAGRG